jgi:hypothetical protein
VAAAERMLLAGRTLTEAAAFFGVAIRTLALRLPGGGLAGLKAKYPDVVIPKRSYAGRPRREGTKPLGRPPKFTPEQAERIQELRAEGKRVLEIAEIMGVGRATIYKILNKDDGA